MIATLASAVATAAVVAEPARPDSPATMPVDAATQPARAFSVSHLDLPGPVRGVAVRVDLADPRVAVRVLPATQVDPDGPGRCITTLDTVAAIAGRYDLEIALNASFFGIAGSKERGGKKVGYFVGNGSYPVGWHVTEGKVLSTPEKPPFENVLLIGQDGAVSIEAGVKQMPAGVRYAVSGNERVLRGGLVTESKNQDKHPRSAVALSADRKTMWLVAIDGRRTGWSAGVTYAELGEILKALGAADGLNLDGGGSTALVVKEPAIGTQTTLNRPSDKSGILDSDSVQRPVADVIAVDIGE